MHIHKRGIPQSVVVNMLDYDIIVNNLELQLFYYIQFQTNSLGKDMNSSSPLSPQLLIR